MTTDPIVGTTVLGRYRIVARLAELRDPALAKWIRDEVPFPCTMVDRIVPATTDADRQIVAEATGTEDAWPIMTEPFTQWVIEDTFWNGRPKFETVGATMARPQPATRARDARRRAAGTCAGGVEPHVVDRYFCHQQRLSVPFCGQV